MSPMKRVKLNDLSGSDDDDDNVDDGHTAKKRARTAKGNEREDENLDNSESAQSSGNGNSLEHVQVIEEENEEATVDSTPPELNQSKGLRKGSRPRTSRKPQKPKTTEDPKPHSKPEKGLLDLPVEVFCEIASQVSIRDLLYLSRSLRSIRNLLMSRSSRIIWTASIKGMGLPACPGDLNEPQYAVLLYDKVCHNCWKTPVKEVDLALRVRLCEECRTAQTVRGMTLARDVFGIEESNQYEIYALVPWANMHKWKFSTKTTYRSSQRIVLRSEFIRVVGQYFSLDPGSEERENFVRERHLILEESYNHKKQMEKWNSQKRTEKSAAKKQMIQDRELSIRNRLSDLGYTKEDMDNSMDPVVQPSCEHHTTWSSIMHQPHELTERRWRIIKPKLESCIINRRKVQRGKELIAHYVTFNKAAMAQGENIFISCHDLCNAPEIKELMAENLWGIEITSERWQIFKAQLPGLNERHRLQIELDCSRVILSERARLVQTMPVFGKMFPAGDSSRSTINTSLVYRADAFFLMQMPTQLALGCPFLTFREVLQNLQRRIGSNIDRKWSPTEVGYTYPMWVITSKLLRSLGLIEDVTLAEINDLGPSFLCERCDPFLKKCMTWGELVKHYWNELHWYNIAIEQRQRKTDALDRSVPDLQDRINHFIRNNRLICDHSMNDPQVLASIAGDEPYLQQVDIQVGELTRCQICSNIGMHSSLTSVGLLIHLRRNHGVV